MPDGVARFVRVCIEQSTEGIGRKAAFTGCTAAERDEHRPRCGAAELEPVLECADRIRLGVRTARDGDLGARCVAVGLGTADPQHDAIGTGFEVIQGESGEFADAQCAVVAEQDEGGVAGAAERRPVDGGHDRAEFGDRKLVGR